jgi:hypothetical protein
MFIVVSTAGYIRADDSMNILPDPVIQERIGCTVGSFLCAKGLEYSGEAFESLFALLKPPTGNERETHHAKLIQQLVYYIGHAPSEEEMWVGTSFFSFARFRPETIVGSLAPYLETNDERVLENLVDLLFMIEDPSQGEGSNFRFYGDYLQSYKAERRSEEPYPKALIGHMFQRSPGRALLTMAEVFLQNEMGHPLPEQKRIRWAERSVNTNIWKWQFAFLERSQVEPEAQAQLDYLSNHHEFWARLYVAEIIRQHPELGTKQLILKLKHDSDELVRKAATAAEATKAIGSNGVEPMRKVTPEIAIPNTNEDSND